MKTVTMTEFHRHTKRLVREAADHGEIWITRRGKVVAKLTPHIDLSQVPGEIPYFARRKMSRAFKKLDESGKLGRGTDSTIAISEDREDRV